MKILKNSIRMHGGLASVSASPVGRMLWFLDLWVHLNQIDSEKISVVETIVQVSRKPKKTDQIPSPPWRAIVPKNVFAPVLLCKLALYEKCVEASATPQGNEIRVSEENSLKIMHSDVTSVNISWKSWKTAFACTEVCTAFRLPLSVACSDFLIYGCI